MAETMADLWWLMLAVGTAVFVLFAVLLVVGLRRRDDGDDEDDPARVRRRHGRWLVGGGLVLPVVVLVVVFGATLRAMRETPASAGADELVIEVVGHQWWWEVRYPEHDVVTANEIHLPVGRPVTFRLVSADVIHSFWIPALGGKIDVLPDYPNTLTLLADVPGRHRSQCAEFCGLQHARMGMVVVAEPPEAFAEWVDGQARPAPRPDGAAAARGREVFLGAECARCHTIAGTSTAPEGPAPDLTHLASRLTLAAGTLENTRANLRAWVEDPDTFKPGVEMPAAELTDAQLDDLVAYLQDLQ